MPAGASWETRRSVLTAWYRKELRQEAAGLMEHWQRRRGVPMNRLLVEAMSRPWGSGDRACRTIRLNSQPAQQSRACHTCIVQHEPAHLRVPARAEELVAMLDSLQPDWAERRRLLDPLPLTAKPRPQPDRPLCTLA
jgi:hypothetical protein